MSRSSACSVSAQLNQKECVAARLASSFVCLPAFHSFFLLTKTVRRTPTQTYYSSLKDN